MEYNKAINIKEALDIAFLYANRLKVEKVDFVEAAGRVLAEPVYSDINIPSFNKSTMDGYACKKENLGEWLDVVEVISAGQPPLHNIESGQCSKIMTGAPVPNGADTVFIIEESEISPSGKVRFTGIKTKSNISLLGEDLKNRDLVLKEGTLLKAHHIAMLATVGCTLPKVYCQPQVGIITTGSELIEPNENPKAAQIRNSNGYQLTVQAKQCQCLVTNYSIVSDNLSKTIDAIGKSIEENDVTLISGGISIGDFDYVSLAIKQLGFDVAFSQLAAKPGKHTTFAIKNSKYIIGLPGNPVSSFVQFEIFVKPFIYRLMNFEWEKVLLPFTFASDYQRKKTEREEFIPVSINENNEAELIKYNGSAHLHAYMEAFGIMNIQVGTKKVIKGETVYVRPI